MSVIVSEIFQITGMPSDFAASAGSACTQVLDRMNAGRRAASQSFSSRYSRPSWNLRISASRPAYGVYIP
ncbi:hypothetical protein D3C73_1473340 [compost metagenome]